ncbi:hypothetical protein C8F04DRAFT_202166 [Mycena alexandri]|uniref:Uncharacterized protein n=1 Tax=Mycena alexandri TaxID=1745969 RepID=A0AAD6TJ32_9AGAR|nr:hypothetical protein C8F04DRAFT_202166 [Mycena alexandri]
MERKAGFFIRLMDSFPVTRAADSVRPGTGLMHRRSMCGLGMRDPVSIRVHSAHADNALKIPNSLAEIVEVVSDTELKIKKEFASGKGTVEIREKLAELRQLGQDGLEFKRLPFVTSKKCIKTCMRLQRIASVDPSRTHRSSSTTPHKTLTELTTRF